MAVAITQGHVPGCIGRIAELHGAHYAASNGFGVAFEARVARELAAFCLDIEPGRDGLFLAIDAHGRIQGSTPRATCTMRRASASCTRARGASGAARCWSSASSVGVPAAEAGRRIAPART